MCFALPPSSLSLYSSTSFSLFFPLSPTPSPPPPAHGNCKTRRDIEGGRRGCEEEKHFVLCLPETRREQSSHAEVKGRQTNIPRCQIGPSRAATQRRDSGKTPLHQTTKVPAADCWTLFWKLQQDLDGAKVKSSGLTLCYVCGQKKNRAHEWPQCIHGRCLAILHTFYAAAGENYSTGSRPGGFERTSQI